MSSQLPTRRLHLTATRAFRWRLCSEFNRHVCAPPPFPAAVGEPQCWAARRLAEVDPHGRFVWWAGEQTNRRRVATTRKRSSEWQRR
jgi:hypothetical protein